MIGIIDYGGRSKPEKKESETYCIYAVVCGDWNDTTDWSIGYTKDIKKRMRTHYKNARVGKKNPNSKIYKRMREVGVEVGNEKVRFLVLEDNIPSKKMACKREKILIAAYDTFEDGLNGTPGGEVGPENSPSQEVRDANGKATKKRLSNPLYSAAQTLKCIAGRQRWKGCPA